MSPQEVLDLCWDLGLEVRVEEGNLYVSPAEKLPETLREQLREQKAALLEILAPQSFLSVKTTLAKLEKQMNVYAPEPGERWIIIHRNPKNPDVHPHSEQEIDEAERRLLAAARATFRSTGDDSGFSQSLQIGREHCFVCRELSVPSPIGQ